jgi:hypothetical protein
MRVGDKVRVKDNNECLLLKVGDIHTVTEIQLGYDNKPMVYVDDTYGMYANRFEVVKPTQHILTDNVIPSIFTVIDCADEVVKCHDNGTLSYEAHDSIRIDRLREAVTALHKLLTENNITKEQFIGK